MEKFNQRKKQKRILTGVSCVLYALSIWAILEWYDWKLLVILMVFVGANNLMVKANEL